MEEVGTQVAFMGRSSFAPRFCDPHPMPKKRSLPSQPHQRPPNNWNPNHWEWDSSKFVATQRESRESPVDVQMQDAAPEGQSQDLQLKLGGGGKPQAATSSLNSAEEAAAAARPNKKVRSGSPGTATYPMCQVDNCKEDLSHAKDYHRRHKVCELHSKATKALVANQMQRFCQQCSRFHPLTEFDEGKRSCRRRLAGHNKRRRKTQPEEATSRVVSSSNPDHNGQLNITNLLTVLAHAQAQVQGNSEEKGPNTLSMPDKDQLLQILTKINTLPLPPNLVAKLPTLSNQSRSVSNQSAPANCSPPNYSPPNGSSSPSTTMNLLAALTGTAPQAPKVVETPLERSSQGSDSEKTNSACSDQVTCLNLSTPALNSLSVGERSSSCDQSPVDDSDCHEIHPNLPLQLFSSSPEDCYPPKIPAGRKYFSSDSSNPSEGRSPSYSPPIAQKLFPVHNAGETLKPVNFSSRRYDDSNIRATEDAGCNTSLQLFAGSTQGADISSVQNSQYQAGYTSSSGSDHSPSSMNSDPQDRTGRIIFKLFDKDPSHLPGTLRKEIHSWLLNSPSEMESYIRPGCVMLSVYASMPIVSWEQFDEKLLHHLKSLIRDFSTDFWATGRFLICTEKQLASHIDGKLRILKTPKAWCSPELLSVTPLAVVSGQETSLLLKGRNLNISGTKVNCSHTVDYTVGDVSEQECQDFDAIMLCKFNVRASASSEFGRCFIEVENGLRVSSFPVIIADELICQELRLLEYEMGESSKVSNRTPAYHLQGQRRPGSRAEVLHFLNEVGWLFQRKCNTSFLESPEYKISRFKFLLIFSVEHNFCSLVNSLLGILVDINLDRESLRKESLEMLSEIHLLNRAVKRKFRSMIDMLLNYSVRDPRDGSRMYLFTPDLVGPGGVTPLHLAACTSRADDMVDALTSDPQKIGLNGWKSLKDASGHSPFAYAAMSNNHPYNKLVGQKVSHEENRHVSVSVGLEIEQQETNEEHGDSSVTKRAHNSCSKCASAAMRYRRTPRSRGLLDRPYIHSMLAIAAVCVCVCLFLRGAPDCGLVAPFKWENLGYGTQ